MRVHVKLKKIMQNFHKHSEENKNCSNIDIKNIADNKSFWTAVKSFLQINRKYAIAYH